MWRILRYTDDQVPLQGSECRPETCTAPQMLMRLIAYAVDEAVRQGLFEGGGYAISAEEVGSRSLCVSLALGASYNVVYYEANLQADPDAEV